MKVAPLIAVALILCIAFPDLIQAKKKPKPNKFCVGKDGNQYVVGEGYEDNDGKACNYYKCVKKKNKFVMKKRKCGPDTNEKVDSLELNVQSLNGSMQSLNDNMQSLNDSMQTLQTTMLSVLELMTTIQSTADKQGSCMSDLSSSSCPDSAPGKIGVVDGINSNKADIKTNKAGITSSKADINANKADINTNNAGITSTKADINTNKAGINTNKAGVNSNKVDINTNKAGITSTKADINTNKADINTNKAGINSTKADINTNKDDIISNKNAIAAHHPGPVPSGPVLIHTDADYNYYKIPVPAYLQMLSTVIATTCRNFGMRPQCFNAKHADSNCIQAPSGIWNEHPMDMSQILCGIRDPSLCTPTRNMFWYMKGFQSAACGATKDGYCLGGNYYTSSSVMPYFAACLKPV